MRVGVHMEKAISPSGGGLAALLGGTSKESFASLLDGEETVQPGLNNLAPLKRREGDDGDQPSEDRRHEHARNVRSSAQHAGTTGSERAPANTLAVQVAATPQLGLLHWNSRPDLQSSGVGAAFEGAPGRTVEGHRTRTGGATDMEPAASRDAKVEGKPVTPAKVIPAEGVLRGRGDVSGAKIPELISSPHARDESGFDGLSAAPEGDSVTSSVQDPGEVFRGDDVQPAMVQSRTGAQLIKGLVVRGVRQSGIGPAQVLNSRDLIGAGSQQHEPDAMPENAQSAQVGGIGAATAGQPDIHSAQGRHDTPGQAVKIVQAADAAPLKVGGAAVELARAGQGAANQRGSALTDGTSTKHPPAAEPSSKEVVRQLAADASTSRMVANAMRGELHVGLHTEAFGRVTIQTNTTSGQFSAQVSLEDSKQSAALAAHLPAVEQRILQQHGLDASVRIISDSQAALAGGSTANGQHGSGANDGTRGARRGGKGFGQGIAGVSGLGVAEIQRERPGRNAALGRLDVMV